MSSGRLTRYGDKIVLFRLIFLLIGGFIVLCSCDLGDLCGDKVKGKCVLVTECKEAEEALRKRKQHGLERCGFQGALEIVCCKEHRDFSVRRPDTRKSVVACKDFRDQITITEFILGGVNASDGEFPHMAALGYEDDSKDDFDFGCGGSLISDNYVLTAAHCLVKQDRKVPIMVRLGVTNLFSKDDEIKPQDITVADVIPHENYNWKERVNDIGLLRLSKPVERTRFVKPICLHMEDDDPAELVVAGFGKTGNTREGSQFLLKTNLIPVDLKTCNTSSRTRFASNPVFETNICATSPDDRPKDTCEGDSGGPMQIEGKKVGDVTIHPSLVGVTSYGPLCGSKKPSIYTRVSKYVDWIEGKVWP